MVVILRSEELEPELDSEQVGRVFNRNTLHVVTPQIM